MRVGDQCSFINYTYVVVDADTKEAIVVDPGWEFDKITDFLFKTGSVLKGVLLTHHHFDHVQLAPDLATAFNVPVFMSTIESEIYNYSCVNLLRISPEQEFSAGRIKVFPYHTPGHTQGSTCFGINNNLFTGDTVFIEGCGICGEEGAAAMFDSLEKLRTRIHPETRIYPGHSYGAQPGVAFKQVLRENIYFNLHEMNRFVAFRTRKNQKGIFNFR